MSAACAVALVDVLYAAPATVWGARLSGAVVGWESWARAVAARGLWEVSAVVAGEGRDRG
ncbi:hypothetical protein [Kitasatospora sp. NPDC059571]|uniref:hypothetical protein n=1 Tax=Kitasatospora sp. NPDC059571 TaxID=3346871 RepID=UPI00369DCAA5